MVREWRIPNVFSARIAIARSSGLSSTTRTRASLGLSAWIIMTKPPVRETAAVRKAPFGGNTYMNIQGRGDKASALIFGGRGRNRRGKGSDVTISQAQLERRRHD